MNNSSQFTIPFQRVLSLHSVRAAWELDTGHPCNVAEPKEKFGTIWECLMKACEVCIAAVDGILEA